MNTYKIPSTVEEILQWKFSSKENDKKMNWPPSVELCNDNKKYTNKCNEENSTDVFYSFLGIYAIGVWAYNNDRLKDDLFKVSNMIRVLNEAKNKRNQILHSKNFLLKLQEKEINGIKVEELNVFLNKTFAPVYFYCGNLIPIWPGGNRKKGFQNLDLPELFFHNHSTQFETLKELPYSYLDKIGEQIDDPKYDLLTAFLQSVNTIDKYKKFINYLVKVIEDRTKLIEKEFNLLSDKT